MIDVFIAAIPILFLVVAMTAKKGIPAVVAFPIAALIAYASRVFFFGTDSSLAQAAVVAGLLNALTPISIVFGAILFFVAMEKSGAMDVVRDWLRGISSNRIAQVMVVAWSFQFLIEGASGFGTPAALAAPILVGLGFPPLRVVVVCLVMNSVPVSFGAVGTPTWFGFGALGLDEESLRTIAVQTALFNGFAALFVPAAALLFIAGRREVLENLVFVYLSIFASVSPMIAFAAVNYEFPAVVGGVIGLFVTIVLARMGIGLKKSGESREPLAASPGVKVLFRALLPLAATVAILLVTRIPALPFRAWLTSPAPWRTVSLDPLGELSISRTLVVRWSNILGEDLTWTHALLYVPSFIPFFVAAALAYHLFAAKGSGAGEIFAQTAHRIRGPVLALFGALVFVQLLIIDGENASTMIIGTALAGGTGEGWRFIAPFLGALGSFFSGSNTISNLTFGGIQASIAANSGLNPHTILALQSAGGAMGNMVCIHNIVAVCAVLGIRRSEGKILKKTVRPLLLYGAALAVAVAVGI